jgi:hypothetical protein
MKTHQYNIGRFRFATKLHIAFTVTCMVIAITALVCAFFNPFHLLYAGGFTALAIASYKEKLW